MTHRVNRGNLHIVASESWFSSIPGTRKLPITVRIRVPFTDSFGDILLSIPERRQIDEVLSRHPALISFCTSKLLGSYQANSAQASSREKIEEFAARGTMDGSEAKRLAKDLRLLFESFDQEEVMVVFELNEWRRFEPTGPVDSLMSKIDAIAGGFSIRARVRVIRGSEGAHADGVEFEVSLRDKKSLSDLQASVAKFTRESGLECEMELIPVMALLVSGRKRKKATAPRTP